VAIRITDPDPNRDQNLTRALAKVCTVPVTVILVVVVVVADHFMVQVEQSDRCVCAGQLLSKEMTCDLDILSVGSL